MPDRDHTTGFAIGMLVGAALGISIGMLYAPHAGRETREMLRDKFGEARHKAEIIVDEARERAKKIIEDAKGKAAETK